MSRRKATGRSTPSSYRSNGSNGNNGPIVNPETIAFFHRSLDRNDVELAAIDELNSTLHSLKTEILKDVRGDIIILQLGEGTVRLFKPKVTIVKNRKGPPPPDAEPPFPPRLDDTPEAALLSPEMKKLCVDFLERMLLRRKLLNRLFRRLLRVSATMDTTDGSATATVEDPSKPPPPPRYGDDRLHIDAAAAQRVFEKVQKQTDALMAKMNPDKVFTPQETANKDDTLFLDFKQFYDRLVDPEDRTNVLQYLADANVTPDEWSGTKVGAIQRNLTSKEKEAEYHRWQAALWARIPLQPTFADLGPPVFALEARKEAAAKAHNAKLAALKAAEEEEKDSENMSGDENKEDKSPGGNASKADNEKSGKEIERGEKTDGKIDESEEDVMDEGKEDKETGKGEAKESKSEKEEDEHSEMKESQVDKRSDNGTKAEEKQEDEEMEESEVDKQKDKDMNAEKEKEEEKMEESEVDNQKAEGKDEDTEGVKEKDEDMEESEADGQKEEDEESETNSNVKDTEGYDLKDYSELSTSGKESANDRKAAADGEEGDKTQEEQKIVRPISLVPVPSFHEQDWKRIRIVQADLMSTSMQDFARRRTQEVIAEYNNALRKSNSLNDRRAALQNQLTSLMQENKNFAAQFERNYKMELDNAHVQWNKRRQEFESARLNYLMPHRNNPHHRPNGTALTKVYSGQPDPARRTVAYCVGDIVDTAIAAGEGQFHLERFQEEFRPPHKESLRNNESYIQKKTMEERLKTEYTSIAAQLRTCEDERQRAWKRMMKTKAEFEIPHQMPHGRVNVDMTNYNLMPLPTLKNNTPELKYHQHAPSASVAPHVHVPSSSRLSPAGGNPMPSRPPNPSMPMSSGNMGANPGTSDSKYSAARVRERISSDGTVAPVTTPKRTKDGLFVRPAGRTRKGMDWDAVRGIWVPNPNYSEN